MKKTLLASLSICFLLLLLVILLFDSYKPVFFAGAILYTFAGLYLQAPKQSFWSNFLILAVPYGLLHVTIGADYFARYGYLYVLAIIMTILLMFLGLWLRQDADKKTFGKEIFYVLSPFLVFWVCTMMLPIKFAEQFLLLGLSYFTFGFYYQTTYFKRACIPLIISVLVFLLTYGLGSLYNPAPHTLPNILIVPLALVLGRFFRRLFANGYRAISIGLSTFFIGLLYVGMSFAMPNWLSYSYNINSNVHFAAPDFELMTADSILLTNKDFEGKIIVLDLWTTSCGVCFRKFPDFEWFFQKYEQREDVKIYAVNIPTRGDTWEKIQRITNKQITAKRYSFPVLFATENADSFEKKFKYQLYPTAIVIDKKGVVRYTGTVNILDYIKINNLDTILQKLLNE